jgi:hypothetical protein
MQMPIKPTPGRIVWFAQNFESDPTHNYNNLGYTGDPLAAIVAKVNDDGTLNLSVCDANGQWHPRLGVVLLQDDEKSGDLTEWAAWMPFQKDQAARYAAREGDKEPGQEGAPGVGGGGGFGHPLSMTGGNGGTGNTDPNVRSQD